MKEGKHSEGKRRKKSAGLKVKVKTDVVKKWERRKSMRVLK